MHMRMWPRHCLFVCHGRTLAREDSSNTCSNCTLKSVFVVGSITNTACCVYICIYIYIYIYMYGAVHIVFHLSVIISRCHRVSVWLFSWFLYSWKSIALTRFELQENLALQFHLRLLYLALSLNMSNLVLGKVQDVIGSGRSLLNFVHQMFVTCVYAHVAQLLVSILVRNVLFLALLRCATHALLVIVVMAWNAHCAKQVHLQLLLYLPVAISNTYTPTTSENSGVITDGTGTYTNNMYCEYLFASSIMITLQFTHFQTEAHRAFVRVHLCETASCAQYTNSIEAHRTTSLSAIYSTNPSRPFMWVRFTSKSNVVGEGSVWCFSGPDNSVAAAGSTTFQRSAGYTGADGGTCSQCSINQYKAGLGFALCTPGLDNSVSAAGSSACQCKEGYTGTNGETCSPCSINQYKAGLGPALCTPCPSNSVSAAGSGLCQCNAGYTGANATTCSSCSPGMYKTEAGPTLCINCPSNYTCTTIKTIHTHAHMSEQATYTLTCCLYRCFSAYIYSTCA